MGGGDMKHDGCLPYNCHDYHLHGGHHKYYDLPHEHHHVHGGGSGHFFRKLNDVAVDFVAGHPHSGHLMIMRRGGRHHLDLIAINGVHNKSLHHRARKMHHHHHHHGHLHDHGHHHKLGNRFWHPIKGHHGGRRHHRSHGNEYYDLHRESDRCYGGCRRSKSVLLVTENRPVAGDVDHTIRNSTSDEKEVAAVEIVEKQPDDHESMELANVPINMLRIE